MYKADMLYDCFIFCDEQELCEIRINELAHLVDYFVISEAEYTHNGEPKPLNFDINSPQLAAHKSKIIYRVADSAEMIKGARSPIYAEAYQREVLHHALVELNIKDDDMVILSDVDEIIRSDYLKMALKFFQIEKPILYRLVITQHPFYLDSKSQGYWANSPIMMRYGEFKTNLPNNWRWIKQGVEILDCGWHFTSLGGERRRAYKMKAYRHADAHDNQEHLDHLNELARNIETVDIGTLPRFVQENIDLYRHLMKPVV